MSNILLSHILHGVDHLVREIPADILAHCATRLADVKKQMTFDVFHHNEDEVFEMAARWLYNKSIIAIA